MGPSPRSDRSERRLAGGAVAIALAGCASPEPRLRAVDVGRGFPGQADEHIEFEQERPKVIYNASTNLYALLVVAKITPLSANPASPRDYNNLIPGLVQTRAAAGKHIILGDMNTGFAMSNLSR